METRKPKEHEQRRHNNKRAVLVPPVFCSVNSRKNKFDFGVPSPQGMVMPIVMMIPKMIKMRIVDGG